jgi:hypothetical protein
MSATPARRSWPTSFAPSSRSWATPPSPRAWRQRTARNCTGVIRCTVDIAPAHCV